MHLSSHFSKVVSTEYRTASALVGYLQGVANNARGLGAELGVAESAPGVVAVSRRFWAAPLQRAAGATFICLMLAVQSMPVA
jgi:hypothetical protein